MFESNRPNQYEMQNPLTQYPQPPFPEQSQATPGLDLEMVPKPDHGEKTYRGFGRLVGRKALITGADSGIGRAVAIAFAREGANVALNYLEEEVRDAREVINLIKAEGQQIFALPGDLKNEGFCRFLVEEARKKLNGLDILVPIAGKQISVKNIQDLDSVQFDLTFKTNVYALFWLCKAALPYMPVGSTIITTSSIQAYDPSPNLLDYAATKAAIVNFTQSLAKQTAGKGIRVNSVAPGPIWTVLQPSGGQPDEKVPYFGENTPMKRPGQPAEVAPIYVLLASQESSYVTGETYGITGGNHLR